MNAKQIEALISEDRGNNYLVFFAMKRGLKPFLITVQQLDADHLMVSKKIAEIFGATPVDISKISKLEKEMLKQEGVHFYYLKNKCDNFNTF